MKSLLKLFLSLIIIVLPPFSVHAQLNKIEPDLTQIGIAPEWKISNREVLEENGSVYLNSVPGNGIVYNNDIVFTDGIIEVDLKGKDVNGRSFIGIAFHVQNDSTYETIYFRPFNFQNADRSKHAVQYISHPIYTWDKLRKEQAGIYESTISPIPDPEDWFHVRIEVNYPEVKVYINDSITPSLEIKQISSRKEGYVGLWVGNSSDGHFKNLIIQSSEQKKGRR